jgi:hypothetical protein
MLFFERKFMEQFFVYLIEFFFALPQSLQLIPDVSLGVGPAHFDKLFEKNAGNKFGVRMVINHASIGVR